MKKKFFALFLAFAMLFTFVPGLALPASAAPLDLNRVSVYSAAEGNIARTVSNPNMLRLANTSTYYSAGNPGGGITQTGINAQYSNAGGRNGILRINDGIKDQAAASAWNNWGSAFGVESNPVYIVYNFGRTYTIEAMRVEFTNDGNGYNSGTQIPRQAFVEYWDGTEWIRATDISRPDGDPHGGPIAASGEEAANFVNDAHIGGNDSIALAATPNWNKVVFNTPIQTSMLRLHLTQRQTANNTNGIGVSEWEVFGFTDYSDEESVSIDLDNLTLLSTTKTNFSLPLAGFNGSTISWVSDNPAIIPNGATAEVTQPATGTSSAVLTATVSKGTIEMTKSFTVLILADDTAPYNLTLTPDNLGIDIAETLYGIFFEDINHSLDGGLNAQMIDNGSFQQYEWMDTVNDRKQGSTGGRYSRDASTIYAWRAVGKNSSDGTATIVSTNQLAPPAPLPGRNADHYQPDYNIAINVSAAPTGTEPTAGYGIAANGYGNNDHYNSANPSLSVNADWGYDVSLFLRGNYSGKVKVYLDSSTGATDTTLRSNIHTISGLTDEWQKFEFKLTANWTGNVKLCVVGDAVGEFNLDFVTMIPEADKLWRGGAAGPLRADVAQTIADLKPGFMRFPGGCASEGMTESRQYFWKDGIYKNLEERRGMPNYWGYWNSNVLGFYEYFLFAEAMGAEPVPVISFGVTCQFHNGSNGTTPGYVAPIGTAEELEAYKALYVQDALDLIEFANGDAETSVWGKKRAEMGHPEPFNLKYVALGNENGGSTTNWIGGRFWERFKICWDAIKAEYPDMEVVTNSDYTASGGLFNVNYQYVDRDYPNSIVDEHMYNGGEAYWLNHNRYDVGRTRGNQNNTYDRNKPTRVMVGEYSYGDTEAGNNKYYTAVDEAIFTTGLERNSDVVAMSCYAPLVAKNNTASTTNWWSNLIYVNNEGVWRTANYYYMKLFSNNVGDKALNSAPGGSSGTAAEQNARRMNYVKTLDGANEPTMYTAPSIDTETGTIYCKIINHSAAPKQTSVKIDNRDDQWYRATLEYIWSEDVNIRNQQSPDHSEAVAPIKEDLGVINGSVMFNMPMWSVGALVLTPVLADSPCITYYTDNLTVGCAANINVKTDKPADGLSAEVTVDGVDYSGTFEGDSAMIKVPVAINIKGKLTVRLMDGDVTLDSKEITMNEQPTDLWNPAVGISGDDLRIMFAADIAPKAGGYAATLNATKVTPVAVGNDTLDIKNAALGDKNTIVISGVKYPLYFPSYSFTFTLTYNKELILSEKYPGVDTELTEQPALLTTKAYQPQHDGEIVYGPDTTGEYWYWDFSTDQGRDYNGNEIRKSKDLVNWEWVGTAIRVYKNEETGKYFHNYPPGVTIEGFDEDTGTYTSRVFQQGSNFWAPYVFDNSAVDGYYYMYYCYSQFATRTSDLGVYRCKALDGVWEFCSVLVETRSDDGPGFNCIDPMVTRDKDGRLWLLYGSFFHGIALVELDSNDPTKIIGTTTHTLARRDQYDYTRDDGNNCGLEGATIVYNPELDYYYLIICYDYLANLYNTRVARSRSITGPYFDANGNNVNYEDHWDSPTRGYAGTKLVGPYAYNNDIHRGWVGTGHAAFFKAQNGHYYITHNSRPGTSTNRPYINVRRVIWTEDGWPLASSEVTAGENPDHVTSVKKDAIAGDTGTNWEFIRQERIVLGKDLQQFTSTTYRFAPDGTVGTDGAWEFALNKDGSADVVVDLGSTGANTGLIQGKVYYGWDWENWCEALLFLGKDEDNTVYWGKQITD